MDDTFQGFSNEPWGPVLENDQEDPEEEEHPRRRIRRVKKFEVMMQECHEYVMAGKRLPKLHSRWIYTHFKNCHETAIAGVVPHNQMVDDLREAQTTIIKLQRRIEELEKQ